ncbi:hypothetical protein PUN28_015551 [Cardiocondyla obscurior]|uniref:Uncharacterized protein n=1 Tax=Cardiocondyla obscurior TaxID=286306 RepID=A0AAW2EXD7_9HYME
MHREFLITLAPRSATQKERERERGEEMRSQPRVDNRADFQFASPSLHEFQRKQDGAKEEREGALDRRRKSRSERGSRVVCKLHSLEMVGERNFFGAPLLCPSGTRAGCESEAEKEKNTPRPCMS